MTKWYEKEAMTALDNIHQEAGPIPNCICAGCTVRREELPAKKIERLLRGILLSLDEMTPEELNCVRVHLQDMRKQDFTPDTRGGDFRNGWLCNLEMYIWDRLNYAD